MMSKLWLWLSPLAIAGLGCQRLNPAFDFDDTQAAASESAGETGETAAGEGADMDAGDGEPGPGDGDGDPNSTAPGDGDGDGDGDPSTGDGDGDPSEGFCGSGIVIEGNEQCLSCVDPACCNALVACVFDPDCLCVAECVIKGFGDFPMCGQMCQLVPEGNQALMAVSQCVVGECGNICLMPG